MLNNITPVILTYNEEDNINRALDSLQWATEILVVDSFSNDTTLEKCSAYNNVRIIQREFDGFAKQCNFALAQGIKTEWVLSMDADYIVSRDLQNEIASLNEDKQVAGYRISFDYLIDGRKLRGSLYPARVALYRRKVARYRQDGHAHKISIDGEIQALSATMSHDDRKPKSRWMRSQKVYAEQEAVKLAGMQWSQLGAADRVRKACLAPLLIVPYTLLFKGLILDGSAGLKYTWQRFIAECCLLGARFRRWRSKPAQP